MSSEMIVVLVLVILSALGLIYVEKHSRRNNREEGVRPEIKEED